MGRCHKPSNNGALWIRKARQKTNQMCNVPVLSIPQRILRKYEDNAECIKKGVLLPVISNQRMNAYLKEIADVCGIAKRLINLAMLFLGRVPGSLACQ